MAPTRISFTGLYISLFLLPTLAEELERLWFTIGWCHSVCTIIAVQYSALFCISIALVVLWLILLLYNVHMLHIVQQLKAEVHGYSHLLKELTVKVRDQDQELSIMRKEVARLLSELGETKTLLSGFTKELTELTNCSNK